jgi:Cof subfamily protein (haloacid dehalogenase superfamily)
MIRARPLPFRCSAVVSDVDGTLVTDDKRLTAPARAAVAALRASGIIFTIISARPPRGLRMLLGPLGITTPVIGFNGGAIAKPELSMISEHLLPPAVARRAVDMLYGHGVQVWVFSGQDWLVRDPNGHYVGLEERAVGFRPTLVEEFGSTLDFAAKIVGVSRDFDLLAQCERDMRTALADSAVVVRSQSYYLDITHPLANKGVALAELAKLLGVPLAEIAVIGDGGNDVAMFERSGLSIAMGNASPQVQQTADLVTESNCDDGFAKAIERIILGGNRTNARGKVGASQRPGMTEPPRTASKISLVLADVDGTLVTGEKVLTPRAAAAVNALQAAGIAFAITSGRPPRGMAMLIDPLALRTPIAGFNGGIFVTPDMTIMEEHVLAADAATRALEVILRNGMDAWVYSGQDWLIRDRNAAHVAREEWTVKFAPTVVADFKHVLGAAVKIVGVSDDPDLVARCEKDAKEVLGAGASAARSQPYYLDVTHPDANKGTVVTTLSKFLSIPACEIATIGDMPNDVMMFRSGGLSIAMGNASPEVQAQADLVTDSYANEGFAKAIEHIILHRAGTSSMAS